MRTLYTAEVTARGGRSGHVRSADGILDIDLRIPREMGGPGEPGSNPEQLFAAAYAACFESTVRAELRGHLEGVAHEDALALMRAAHDVCPYSNATRGNVDVRLLIDDDLAAVA